MEYRYNYYFFDLLLFNNCVRVFEYLLDFSLQLDLKIPIYLPCDNLLKIISNILPNEINL